MRFKLWTVSFWWHVYLGAFIWTLYFSNLSPFFYSRHLGFLLLLVFCLPSLSVFPPVHLKAFAWWSDLMVEHAETFLCLYSADMDAALEVQPPDSWDSFPLFQLLNDFLRMDCKLGAIMRNNQNGDWSSWTCQAVSLGGNNSPYQQVVVDCIHHLKRESYTQTINKAEFANYFCATLLITDGL